MRIIKYNQIREDFFRDEELGEIASVKRIIREVKNRGDAAVKKYAEKFDALQLDRFEVSKEQVKAAYKQVDRKTFFALMKAAVSIGYFAKLQYRQLKGFEVSKNGNVLGQRVIPIGRVGCYVPGGRYPLPSTALMTVIPAKVAGVTEVIVCSPKIQPVSIVAADIAGADRIFSIGGVQAIAAMAYGTETVPKVDKIVGPGNKFVAAAKKEVYGTVGIDFVAGPSEVLIIADNSGNAKFIAADLLAQAEHDVKAKCWLVSTSERLAKEVNEEVKKQLCALNTAKVAEAALQNSFIIVVKNLNEAIEIANRKAPEHLGLQVRNPGLVTRRLKNYGSMFIGTYSAEVFGDYYSGPNHTLPTNGAARYSGGLSVKDFVKIVTYQKFTKLGAKKMVVTTSRLASVEGLEAHKRAAEIRK